MCGIAGIIGNKASNNLMSCMLKAQSHRGPDNTSIWNDNYVSLGHNRLSIIDLSEDANQPFLDNSGRYVLVFNGEIYNYVEIKNKLLNFYDFKTKSDSEVLLAAYIKWGKNCLEKLNGMFSFAIWDKKTGKLFAARDRFGVKPFYYHKNNEGFYFSSEIKTLFATEIVKKPNEKVWANYFSFGSYGLPNETFWEDISQLPAAHFLELSENKITINKWYHFEKEVEKHAIIEPFETVVEKYQELLIDSIKLRFRADVPVGFNLSGGLDSSTLLAFVNTVTNNKNINAYTFYTGDSRYDELPWVKEMISLTQNPLNEILLNKNSLEKSIKEMSFYQDEPYGGIPTVAYGKLFKQARIDGVKVLLDGQGMDEQWAGYDYYTKQNNSVIQGVTKSPFRKNVLNSDFLNISNKPEYSTLFSDNVKNLQYRDLFYTKIPRALRFNDRVSMQHGTELREPFLDYRLVEYAFSQPLEYKVKNGVQKYLLRKLVSKHLSDKISYAPKRALQTPQREWLGKELKSFVENQLEFIANSEYKRWFNVDNQNLEWKKYLAGDNDSSFHIWQWISVSLLMNKEN